VKKLVLSIIILCSVSVFFLVDFKKVDKINNFSFSQKDIVSSVEKIKSKNKYRNQKASYSDVSKKSREAEIDYNKDGYISDMSIYVDNTRIHTKYDYDSNNNIKKIINQGVVYDFIKNFSKENEIETLLINDKTYRISSNNEFLEYSQYGNGQEVRLLRNNGGDKVIYSDGIKNYQYNYIENGVSIYGSNGYNQTIRYNQNGDVETLDFGQIKIHYDYDHQ
jgi:hypothetical protein